MRILIVVILMVLGVLLSVIGLCGVTGFCDKFLFIPLTCLFNSFNAVWLFAASLILWFFAGVLTRIK